MTNARTGPFSFRPGAARSDPARHPHLRRPGLLATIALGGLLAAQTAQSADLVVTIHGVESSEGNVLVAVYASQEAFTQREQVRGAKLAAKPGPSSLTLRDIPAGIYCVSVIHDRDADGALSKGWLGAPKEPYGFSRNARGRLGPPGFDAMSFRLGDEAVSVEIEVR